MYLEIEFTSCGLNGKPLSGFGLYPAHIAFNLYSAKTPFISHKLSLGRKQPFITQILLTLMPVMKEKTG